MNKKLSEALKRPFGNVPIPKELKKVHQELSWLYQEGESNCGIQSNFNAMIKALKTSATHQETSAEDQLNALIDHQHSFDHILRSTSKWKKIMNKFQSLSPHSKNTLEYFFYEKQYDVSVEMFFGQGAALIPYTATFQEKFIDKIVDLNQLKYHIIHDSRRMKKIKSEIAELYISALQEYSQIKEEK